MTRRIQCLLLVVGALIMAFHAYGQTAVKFPSRPVRVLIPFAPGGSTDFVARVMQTRMMEVLGQPIVIDNRPGASGNIAVEIAANAPGDGHTVLFGNVGAIAINPVLFRDFPVDTVRDLQCVSVVADVSSVLVVNATVPATTFEEFVRYAKGRPGQLNFASSGAGSNGRLTMEFFTGRSGISLGHIAYKGASGVVNAMLSNETQVGIGATPAVLPHLQSGRLKALAILSAARISSLPQVPTMGETGFPELTSSSWQGLYVPAKTPTPVIEKLRASIVQAITQPSAVEALRNGGASPVSRTLLDECNVFTKQQVGFWSDLVRKVGLAGKQ